MFRFHLKREGGGGGEGGGQGRKTTSMPQCNVSGGGGEGGCQENKTTPMANCNVLWICAIVRFAIKIDDKRNADETHAKTTSCETLTLPKTTARKTR